ncbi:MAG: hypothetical protein IPH18_02655 [Chitinophagaceae bacterium]|nr:hypothetical protein [Chitinophagaceae bacterium]
MKYFRKISLYFFSGLLLLLSACPLGAVAQYNTDTVEYDRDEGVVADENTGESETTSSWFNSKDERQPFTVQERKMPSSALNKMKEDEAFWYANARTIKKSNAPKVIKGQKGEDGKVIVPDKAEEESSYKSVGNAGWLQALFWIIAVGGFVTVLIWYLASSNVGFFRRKDKMVETAVAEEEEMPEDIFAINYQKEIDKAVAARNYRLAVRLQYLRLLKNMTEKGVITYKQDKTNFDYLAELQPRPYYNGFFTITRNYEYSWYGKFEVSDTAYTIIQNEFTHLSRQLHI